MNKQKKRGRKRKRDIDKVKSMQAYLTISEQKKIRDNFKSLTEAVREHVLPACESNS